MNGIIVINKEKGYTSHDVVAKVKKILNVKKVGHTGTLDPNATGVLPLLLGMGTKLSKYLIEHDKEYDVTLKFGIKTDTADVEGKVVEEREFDLSKIEKDKLEEILNSFIGKQKQMPPMYSAIKVNGKKLYEYAREGSAVEVSSREIEIFSIQLIDVGINDNEIRFRVHCSKGTYIRSLCEDIAKKLNTIGFMKELNRTRVGRFSIHNSISIEELEAKKDDIEELKKHIISIEDFFENTEKIEINDKDLQKIINGDIIYINKRDGLHNLYNKGKYIGVINIKNTAAKREIIL